MVSTAEAVYLIVAVVLFAIVCFPREEANMTHLQEARLAAQLEAERKLRVAAKKREERALAERNAVRKEAGLPPVKNS